MKISLAITTFNRFEFTIESFAQVIDDPRIDDIVILDDCSTDGSYEKLRDHFAGNKKVRVIRQAQNRGMSITKRDAIALCNNPDVIIFDSDNKLGKDYLDALEAVGGFEWNKMYLPVAATPNFNYRRFAGRTIDNWNIKLFMSDEMFRCALNTCNCLVNRDFYLHAFVVDDTIGCADTINHIYNHLRRGGKLYFVPGMEYFHRVHAGSGFLQDAGYNMKKAAEVRKLIMQL